MPGFVKVATVDELADPGHHLVELDDRLVVVFHVDGEVYCLEDVCTHDGGTLGDGQLTGYEIACPRHGAKFDIRSGKALTMPATEDTRSYEAKIEGGAIFVKVSQSAEEAATATPLGSSFTPSANSTTADSTVAAESPSPSAAPTSAGSTGELSEDKVREELKKVIDPELFVNIVDLGLIYVAQPNVRPDGKYDVEIEMTMTSPACPAGPQLIANSKNVVSQLDEVVDVEVRIVMDPPWTPDKMTEDARDQLGIF